MRKKLFGLLLAGAWLLIMGSLLVPRVNAGFVANNLIDDSTFNDAYAVDAGQINTFLNTFPSSCISTNSGFEAKVPSGYSSAGGFTFGNFGSAGQVIATAAQAYGINPKVLLVTLEKEQSLVTGRNNFNGYCNNGDEHKYAAAMGYGCPDSGGTYSYTGVSLYRRNGVERTSTGTTCVNSAAKAGFSQQIIRAAWLLKFDQQHAIGNYNWAIIKPGWDNSDDLNSCYSGPMTQGYYRRGTCDTQPIFFDGYTTIDSTSVHMDTGATAALYHYTPHFNGNQNFVSLYESWFGPTTGEGYVLATSYLDNGDPRQWVVYRGQRRLVNDTDTLKAWGLDKVTLLQWTGTYLGSFPTADQPLTRLFRPSGSLDVYFVDGGNCYRVTSGNMLSAWNFNPASIMNIPVYLGRVPTNSGNLTFSIRNAANNGIYLVDGGSLRLFADNNILAKWEGSSGIGHQTISNTYLSMMGSAPAINGVKYRHGLNYYLASQGQVFVTTDQNIADEWGIKNAPALNVDLSVEYRPFYMMTRFARSAYPNDTRLFAIENGTLYHLSPEHAANLGLSANTAVMAIVPEDITANITPWSWILVQDASGKKYVIDGGTKRSFHPDGQVQNSWTANNTIPTPPVFTNGFLNLLPNNGNIEREIKGSGLPQYVVEGLTKRWVQNPSTSALYAPLQQVSDSLINVLPNGSNIP